MASGLRVVADQETCISSGQCVEVAPAVFDQDDDGIVLVLQPDLAEELREAAEYAARICPSRAIKVLRET